MERKFIKFDDTEIEEYEFHQCKSPKLRCLELNSFVSDVFITLLEEQALSSDLLHSSGLTSLAFSQLVKSFKYLTRLSQTL